ncbi:hypothetical protein F9Y90_00885 [Borrelia miyamotoi]|uniref:Uncharacterized protein n=1 Tax=Borrelia miyamotoi TaxID=47466 RepID=A0AAX3JKY6_9SPIR|nr:hypothetical protein [Borrelia miyamotoi]QFP41696.1 hypothetical protein F9Y90_00885 [Borrelia miyamotoi]QFP47816.1 hypothetical protein F9Y91_00880 [Borrelia miyamotoi]QGT55576.1 hypothetical protein GNY89_00890 [Borrelia miyamotoi]QGT56360.1 hypothetical protein GNY88_00890 [Borrelia miyamotoi]WAZ71606.1 hypothetical protein O5404_00890 [Borrelia miyamotoi]
MNLKVYFPHLYHYLFNHESIKGLSVFEKEIEIIKYLEENKKTISTFIDENFQSDADLLIQYVKKKTDIIINPIILSNIDSIDLNIVKDLFRKEFNKNNLELIFNSIKANPHLRKEFLYNFNVISNGYITFYINKLFEDKNSYTIYLIKKENDTLDSSKIIKNYLKILLLLRVLIIKFYLEKEVKLISTNIENISKLVSKEIDFLDDNTTKLITQSLFKYENVNNMSPIATLISIFANRTKIPNIKNNKVKGFLGYDESWFSIKQSSSKEYDPRIMKELLEIARKNKW